MPIWYSWGLQIPEEKEEEAKEVLKKHDLDGTLMVKWFKPLGERRQVWVETYKSAMTTGESSRAREVLKTLAKMIEGTDLDGQTITIAYEGDENDALVADGKILYLEILSVKRTPKGLETIIEAREEEGPLTRFRGVLTECCLSTEEP